MFFFSTPCLQSHQRICKRNPRIKSIYSWKLAYGCIRPWRTLNSSETPTTLFLQGTPFRKLRPGCENCLRALTPEGSWLGAKEQAKASRFLLMWTRLTFYISLRRIYQDKMVAPLILMIRNNKSLFHNREVVDLLLAF